MSEQNNIEPHKITKPIQLLAAWLIGLILVNGAFLVAAGNIHKPEWVSGALVVASILNVPIFLISIFLLQTKFRPEMQEDSFYSRYLESKTGNSKREIAVESIVELRKNVAELERVVGEKIEGSIGNQEKEKLTWYSVTVMLNKSLKNFNAVAKSLSNFGIPIHEIFGGHAGAPSEFQVAIGRGFTIEQIKKLVEALSFIPDGRICFAFGEEEGPDQYNDQILIGAYGSSSHGVEIEKASALLSRNGITAKEAYKMFGA